MEHLLSDAIRIYQVRSESTVVKVFPGNRAGTPYVLRMTVGNTDWFKEMKG
jgi:hypothetical protein